MLKILIIFEIISQCKSVYLDDYEELPTTKLYFTQKDREFTPIITLTKDSEKIIAAKNINCEDFANYSLNCTTQAALIYNSTRKTLPMPEKIPQWCNALELLTSCAADWNADCKEVTDSRFYDESIRGHNHVVNKVCQDEWYLAQYSTLAVCVEKTESAWENCYSAFTSAVDEQKNKSQDWTHYETHFYLCCARARFRRCTLDSLFETPMKCEYQQSVVLQKFSVILSEGDVYQDCNFNMMYSNCPGGDPRPNPLILSQLMLPEPASDAGLPATIICRNRYRFICAVINLKLWFVFVFNVVFLS